MAFPDVSIQLVSHPDEALVEEAVDVFSKLMPESRAVIALTGGNISLLPDLARSMIRPLAFIAGDMYTATDENGVLVGFTLWTPSGQVLFGTEDQRQLGYFDFMNKLSEEAQTYYAQVLGKDLPAVTDEFTGIPDTELNTYWCDFNFVRADYQGRGIAKAMFALAHEKAKKNGYTMALSTTNERNVAIYESLGFTLKGSKEMPSPWGGWPTYVFVRETKEDRDL